MNLEQEYKYWEEAFLHALNYLDNKPWGSKNNSRDYDVYHNNKLYPPKQVYKYAAKYFANTYPEFDVPNPKGGTKTNEIIKKYGFKIVPKNEVKMNDFAKINNHLFNTYWTKYKAYFRLPDSEQSEKYKWAVLKQVYDNWNWNVENKPQMFKNAFEVTGPKNLWMSGNFYPIAHTNWMFENFSIETENIFTNLLNESLPLTDRVNDFIIFYDNKLPELQKLVPDKKINYHSHNDLRAIALYLSLQYPEKYFLFKYGMVKSFCKKMGLPKIKAGNKENLEFYLSISNQILELIKEDEEFIDEYRIFTEKESNYNDDSLHLLTQDFIYTVANHFNDGVKYWRIGSNDGETSFYNEMLKEEYIAIGWNDIGDLDAQNIKTKKEVIDLLITHNQKFKTDGVRTRKAGEIFDFYFNANNNDIVTLMDGNTVLAIGKINDNYNYNKTLPFAHNREIIWLKKNVKNFILNDGPQTTFYQLVKKQTIDKINNMINATSAQDDSKTNNMNSKQYPLNQILYGPPGTGKTYKTKKLAVEIIENIEYSDSKEDRAIILKKYEEYVTTENIHFSTFHQSMSYEDFIEGIKPETFDNQVTYDVKDGIFKEICEKAIVKKESNFEEAYKSLIKEITEIKDDYLLLKTPTGKKFRININSNNNLNLYTSEKINKQGTVTQEKLLKQINGLNEFSGWEGYVNSIISYLKSKHKLVTNTKTKGYKNYVLIIDEINRGNVSAIFGELITLIETDKRAGQKEAISVILPYSKKRFSVPDNIYIIGTMNTADRSVEALDTALRRRFSFEEILPKPALLNELGYKGVNLELLLDKINQRIELLVDKDHQIGHSYFFNINSLEDLKLVFKDKIIPLLEEYFYGDFGKIGLVLGENFITPSEVKNKSVLASFKDYEDIDFISDKKIFRLKSINEMKETDFISIYQVQDK